MKKKGPEVELQRSAGTKSEENEQCSTAKAVACTVLAVRVFKGDICVLVTAKAVASRKAQLRFFHEDFGAYTINTRF